MTLLNSPFCLLTLSLALCMAGCSRSAQEIKKQEAIDKRQKQETLATDAPQGTRPERSSPSSRPSGAEGSLATRLYEQNNGSVFVILVRRGNEQGQGSGFLIGPDGLALSNYHVFSGQEDQVEFHFPDGSVYRSAQLLRADPNLDYVAFRITGYRNKRFIAVASTEPPPGADVFAIGTPQGLTNSITKGTVSGYREDRTRIQTDAAIAGGSSGGVLLNTEGQAVGITSAGIPGTGLNFAINLNRVPIAQIKRMR